MKFLIIGHSWVRRLAAYRSLLPNGADILGVGGATFRTAVPLLESYAARPEVKTYPPFLVIVVLGGNEISKASSCAEVDQLTIRCQEFCELVKERFPEAKIAVCQVEDRYQVLPRVVIHDHKRFGNRFNTWLNRWRGKDALVTIKGARVLSDPDMYMVDGVHLNAEGYDRFCQRLTHVIWKLWQN